MTLILFDIDGTLTATNKVDACCYAAAYQRIFSLPLPSTDWETYTHCTDTGILDEALRNGRGHGMTEEDQDAFENAFVQELTASFNQDPSGFQEIPGAKAMLDALGQQKEVRAALATGGMRASARYKLSRIGVDATLLPGAYANDANTREGIAQCAMARANGHVHDIVYVGDGPWDARTSAALGMRFIGIVGDADPKRLQDWGATVCLPSFTDLHRFFDAVSTATVPVIPEGQLKTRL